MFKWIARNIRDFISNVLPNTYIFNYMIAVLFFMRGNRRPPRRPTSENATINDLIFDRMISKKWNVLEQTCVDKEYAKLVAKSLSDINVARTVSVLRIENDTSIDHVRTWLEPFIGKRLVLKPTHLSGIIVFLDKDVSDDEIEELLRRSKKSYFRTARETQYINLERKLIVEENISGYNSINDYKFFCVNGNALYCQVDVDRFTDHKRAICDIPDFKLLPVRSAHDIPVNIDKPNNLEHMIVLAELLSSPFSFVRVDIYNVESGIYFGEYTFAPGAGSDNMSNEEWAVELCKRVKTAERQRTR